jgi:hypothetical protein
MCMSGGGGGSSKSLRAGQLGVAQRGVSTSRVAGFTLQNKGWSTPTTSTVSKEITQPKPQRGAMNWGIGGNTRPEASLFDRASAVLAPHRNAWDGSFSRKAAAPGEKRLIEDPNAAANRMMGLGGFSTPRKPPAVGEVRKTAQQFAFRDASGKLMVDTVTSTQTYKEAEWKAQMAKNALQSAAVNDGSKARIKSRGARSAVANVNQNSRFSGKRPKTGSLRIDTSGAQVSGGGKVT